MKFKAIFSKKQLDAIFSKIAKYLPLAGGVVSGNVTITEDLAVSGEVQADSADFNSLSSESVLSKKINLVPELPANVLAGSIFIDSSNSDSLSFKKMNGSVVVIVP